MTALAHVLAAAVLLYVLADACLAAVYAYIGWLEVRALEAERPPFNPAELRPGDLLVFRTRGWVGKAIRRLTWGRWNHVAIYVGAGLIVEATPERVKPTPLKDYAGVPTIQTRFPLEDWQRTGIVAWAMKSCGRRYGWLDDLCLGLGRLGIRPRLLDDYARDDARVCCSQEAAYAYAAVGAAGWLSGTGGSPVGEREPWYTVPQDIATAALTYVPRKAPTQ